MTTTRDFLRHTSCPKCNSSNNLAVYSDGYSKCFGMDCGYFSYSNSTNEDNYEDKPVSNHKLSKELLTGTIVKLTKRGITEETCRKFGYSVADYKGKKVQVAPYYRNGEVIAQKIRGENKEFTLLGDAKNLPLFGSNLWSSGKMIVITEGEIDALTVSQLQGNKWPVVSLPNGAGGAKRAIANSLEYLSRFEKIILFFDADEPGRVATEEVAELLPAGRVWVASCGAKDPNAALLAGAGAEVINALWNARPHRPDGFINLSDLEDSLDKPIEYGLSYPWKFLTDFTYGIRKQEIITLLSGSGMGKTEFLKEIVYHLSVEHRKKCGVFFLEEAPEHTAKCLVGKHLKKRIHLPSVESTPEERHAGFKAVFGDDSSEYVTIYNHKGCSEFETIKHKIRYLVHQGVEYIFLDHITALAEGKGEDSVNSTIHLIMQTLNELVMEMPFTIFLISHIRKRNDKKTAEEGGRVTLDDAYGSGAIKQRSNFIFSLERNQQAEDVSERGKTTLRVLKDRLAGTSVGKTGELLWDESKGVLYEGTTGFSSGSEDDLSDF